MGQGWRGSPHPSACPLPGCPHGRASGSRPGSSLQGPAPPAAGRSKGLGGPVRFVGRSEELDRSQRMLPQALPPGRAGTGNAKVIAAVLLSPFSFIQGT